MSICPNCHDPIRDGQETRTVKHTPISRSRYQWSKAVAPRTEIYHADCGRTPEAAARNVAAIREAAKANGMESDPGILQAIAQLEAQS